MCWCHHGTLMCNSVEKTDIGENRPTSASGIVAGDTFRSHARDVTVPRTMLSAEYKHPFVSEGLRLIWCHNVIATGISKIIDLCVCVVIVAIRVVQNAR